MLLNPEFSRRAKSVTIESRALAMTLSIPAVIQTIFTGGYYGPGDGGGAVFNRTNDAVSLAGFQTADGQKWEITGGDIDARAFGARGGFIVDDTVALNACMDFCKNRRARMIISAGVPGGVYKVTPYGNNVWAGFGNMPAAFLLRQGLQIVGVGQPTIRICDNFSTNANPKNMSMFFSNGGMDGVASPVISDFNVEGVILDMNGQNNKQNHGLINHSHVHVSGNSAHANDVLFTRCDFINTSGTNCVVTAQPTSGSGHNMGKNWRILDCRFIGGGTDTVDHSAIFGWSDNIIVDRCYFESPGFTDVLGNGGNVACELHGSNFQFTNNKVVGPWQQMVWISENATTESVDMIVTDNIADNIVIQGIAFFGAVPTNMPARYVKVTNNKITLNPILVQGLVTKMGIVIASQHAQEDWEIAGNDIRTLPGNPMATTGIMLVGGSLPNEKHTRGLIQRNMIWGCSLGIAAFTYDNTPESPHAGMGTIVIRDNLVFNGNSSNDPVGNPGNFAPNPTGIFIQGAASAPFDDLTIEGNNTYDTRGAGAKMIWGLRMSGNVTRLQERMNRASGVIVNEKDFTGLTYGFRYGSDPVSSPTADVASLKTAVDGILTQLVQMGLVWRL